MINLNGKDLAGLARGVAMFRSVRRGLANASTCEVCHESPVYWSCEKCDKDLCGRCADRPPMSQSQKPIYCPGCRPVKKNGGDAQGFLEVSGEAENAVERVYLFQEKADEQPLRVSIRASSEAEAWEKLGEQYKSSVDYCRHVARLVSVSDAGRDNAGEIALNPDQEYPHDVIPNAKSGGLDRGRARYGEGK